MAFASLLVLTIVQFLFAMHCDTFSRSLQLFTPFKRHSVFLKKPCSSSEADFGAKPFVVSALYTDARMKGAKNFGARSKV